MHSMLWKKAKENRRIRVWATVAFMASILANALANLFMLGGNTTNQVSDKYDNLFVPAGFTFLIWTPIYLLLTFYTLFQLGYFREKRSKLKPELLNQVSKYFAITSGLNAAWIVAWHFEVLWLSVIIIGSMLYCLFVINEMIKDIKMTGREKLLVRTPFSMYYGWITVATIANVTAWIVSVQWDGWGRNAIAWTVSMLIVGALVSLTVTNRNVDMVYGLVFVWAYLGIFAKHLAGDGWHGEYPAIIGSVISLIAVMLFCALNLAHKEYDVLRKLI
jgi:hypothetical protein